MNKRSGEESKKKILKAARRVFSKFGYKGASMRMIAKGADISLGGLYVYFRNKEDLYSTLIVGSLENLLKETKKALRGVTDPAEAIRTFLSMRVQYARKHRELILALGKEQGFSFCIEERKNFFAEQRRIIEEIVRQGIAWGIFRECAAEEVAKTIVCTLRGFILSIIVEPDAMFSPEECSALLLEGLFRGSPGCVATSRYPDVRVRGEQ